MKKLAFKLVGLLFLLVIIALIALFFSLNSIVKRGVETKGPTITKVDVKLASVNLSPFSGQGQLTGLVVGNPPGFSSDPAIKVGAVKVALKPSSVFSDTILIDHIYVEMPEINLEGNLKGSNLSKILDNIQSSTPSEPGAAGPEEKKAPKKMQIGDLKITGGKIIVNMSALGLKTKTAALPEIHLTELGKDSGGITARELSLKLTKVILDNVLASAGGIAADLQKGLADPKGALKEALQQTNRTPKEVKDALKKLKL